MMSRLRTACTIAAFAVVLAVRPFALAPGAAGVLPHLHGIDEVREWFNASKGHVRLILLLSPT